MIANLLSRISELEQQLAVLRAEVEKEEKENKKKGGGLNMIVYIGL